jgi:uncharacterized protein (DUF2062 family)
MNHRLRRAVQVLLRLEDPPHRTALAFAIGVWIAFFPIVGTHTALALLIAFAFRLNRVTLLLGAYVNNPWTLVPLFMAGTFFGCLLLGIPPSALVAMEWPRRGWDAHEMFVRVRPVVGPFLLGNLALGSVSAFVSYALLRRVLERGRTKATPPAPPAD